MKKKKPLVIEKLPIGSMVEILLTELEAKEPYNALCVLDEVHSDVGFCSLSEKNGQSTIGLSIGTEVVLGKDGVYRLSEQVNGVFLRTNDPEIYERNN